MKTWQTLLIGAFVGPLVGFPLLLILEVSADNPFMFVPRQIIMLLGRLFISANDKFAGLAFAMPVSALYFVAIGILVALGARHLCRRLHAAT